MDNTEITLVLSNRMSELERLAPLVEQFGECNCFTPKEVFRINLALDELITNIINYGYEDAGEHEIRVELSIQDKFLTMVLVDDARPFNPPYGPLSPDRSAARGAGPPRGRPGHRAGEKS